MWRSADFTQNVLAVNTDVCQCIPEFYDPVLVASVVFPTSWLRRAADRRSIAAMLPSVVLPTARTAVDSDQICPGGHFISPRQHRYLLNANELHQRVCDAILCPISTDQRATRWAVSRSVATVLQLFEQLFKALLRLPEIGRKVTACFAG